MSSKPFLDIVHKAMLDLRAWQERNPGVEPTVWAIPTCGTIAGQVIVADRAPDEAYRRGGHYMPRVIRPSDNRAHTARQWNFVPFAEQWNVLYRALYREPILPPVSAKLEA
jgi:hypothetical protein